MAIISTLTRRDRNVIGDRAVTTGIYTGGASGEIDTKLEVCDFLDLQGSATVAGSAAVVNATFPMQGSAVPIVPAANGGNWFAYGR